MLGDALRNTNDPVDARIWMDENFRMDIPSRSTVEMQWIIASLVSLGTHYVLAGDRDAANIYVAIIIAMFAQKLEGVIREFQQGTVDHESRSRLRDMYHGYWDVESARFFSERNNCDCLTEVLKKLRKQIPMPVQGVCDCCGKEMDRRKLFLCSRCKLEHYCDSKCQKAAWPKHKKICDAQQVHRCSDFSSILDMGFRYQWDR